MAEDLTPQDAAIEQLRREELPNDWKWVICTGKRAFQGEDPNRNNQVDRTGTCSDPITAKEALERWGEESWRETKDKKRRFMVKKTGLGVATGDASNGLVAVDIDGPMAENLLKARLKDDYPDPVEPGTMSWRGRDGRRQIVYRIPEGLRSGLRKFSKEQLFPELEKTEEEVCIRYNGMYSVVPGSKHPDTGKLYEWISYNDGVVAEAPGWLIEFMMSFAQKPQESHSFIPEAYLKKTAKTEYSYAQMRGIWWGTKGGDGGLWGLISSKPEWFQKVFYAECWEEGNQPLSIENAEKNTWTGGCPFHESNSGTSFAVFMEHGAWYCHKEQRGGDNIRLLHALKTQDIDAGDPEPIVLEQYLRDVCGVVGKNFPEDFREAQKTREEKVYDPLRDGPALNVAREIVEEHENPAFQDMQLLQLIGDYGLRISIEGIKQMLLKDEAWRASSGPQTWQEVKANLPTFETLIPDLLSAPSTVVVHGAGGTGKSNALIGLSNHVVKGKPMKIRGGDVPVKQGKVMWCNGDQSQTMLDEQLMPLGLDQDDNFIRWPSFNLLNWHAFKRELNKHKPALVVIDSLAGCTRGLDENKREISEPLYLLENRNGVDFPATCIVIIHHDNKNGTQFRGHSSIRDSVSEVWHVESPTDQEIQENAYGAETDSKRIITVGKSRFDRSGSKFISTLNDDFTMDFADWTPCERVLHGGRVTLIDRVLRFVRDQTDQGASVTSKEICDAMGKPVTTINTMTRRLSQKSLILSIDLPREPGQRGKAKKAYVSNSETGVRLASVGDNEETPSRGEGDVCVSFKADPLQDRGSENKTPTSESGVDSFNGPVSPTDIPNATKTEPASSPKMSQEGKSEGDVSFTNPVTARDPVNESLPGTHPAHARDDDYDQFEDVDNHLLGLE